MDRTKFSSIIGSFFAGMILMPFGISTRGDIISMFLIIGGGAILAWALIKLFLFVFYREPVPLGDHVEKLSPSGEPMKDRSGTA
ncbi:MAG: hypothetical protein LLG16_05445 [Euryarchaeota archaeon]|nr:hypothetical protein [Euryarchaeota archaeon]